MLSSKKNIKLLVPFILFIILFGCKSEKNIPTSQEQIFQPKWINDIPLTYPTVSDFAHDNRIYETEHFLVYSDAASDSTKIEFAEMGEKSYNELKTFFLLSENQNFNIQIENPTTKIQIICNKNDPRSQRSFMYGFMLYTLDSPFCFATEENLFREVKHELTHVFQMYLDGSSRRYAYGWFREGLAEYAADGGFFPQITTLADFNSKKELLDYYNFHPLKIYWSQLRTIPANIHPIVYAMSGLATRFMLDQNGMEKSIEDYKQIFNELKQNENIAFETVFENVMEFNIHDFEDGFYSTMENFLH